MRAIRPHFTAVMDRHDCGHDPDFFFRHDVTDSYVHSTTDTTHGPTWPRKWAQGNDVIRRLRSVGVCVHVMESGGGICYKAYACIFRCYANYACTYSICIYRYSMILCTRVILITVKILTRGSKFTGCSFRTLLLAYSTWREIRRFTGHYWANFTITKHFSLIEIFFKN